MAKLTAEEKQAYAAILRAQGGDVSESRLEGEKGKTRTPAGPAGRRGSGAVQVADAGCSEPSRRPPVTNEGKLLVVTHGAQRDPRRTAGPRGAGSGRHKEA